jgi:hypothetical protein
MDITVPRAFLESPRWWRGGGEWLAGLPELVRAQCARWRLTVDGEPAHGSNAPGDVMRCFGTVVRAAGIGRDHARDWVLFRAVDYWLWGLGAGLTEDPQRCRRLVSVFSS